MGERHSKHIRDKYDWYVEPEWCIDRLFNSVKFDGRIHDPCCGMGTIPRVASKHGYLAFGSDIVVRGYGWEKEDFLKAGERRVIHNVVTNPPYKIAQAIIEKALIIATGRVAVLVQTKFLSSQGRHKLFSDRRLEKVIIFSSRPSMPPGKELEKYGERIRGGGSIDYCWIIWNQDNRNKGTIEWTL